MGKDGPFYAILLDKKPGGVESRNNLSLYYWEELEKMIKRSGIESVFDIAGDDEAGITKSFGIILRKDKTLLKKLLSIFDSKIQLSKELFENSEFLFEKKGSHGRTDIEIRNDKIHVIIESKTGKNKVTLKQAGKYADYLKESKSEKKIFIFLTEVTASIDRKLKENYPNIIFGTLGWEKTLEMLRERRTIKVNLVEEYEKYLIGGREMKIHDIDIWAVSITKPMQIENYEKRNFYRNDKEHRPILIGRREWDKGLKRSVIKELRPVLKVLDKSSQEAKKYQKYTKGGGGNCYIYMLGRKLILEKPIIKKKKWGQQSAIAESFDILSVD